MILELDPSAPVAAASPRISVESDGTITITGGSEPTHVYAGEGLCLVATDRRELLDGLRARGVPNALDPQGVSEFLHHGFVAMPRTIRPRVYRLGPGDTLGAGPGYVYRTAQEWPWLNRNSRQDGHASTAQLLEHLAGAVRRAIGAEPATLLLSSGKDSVALALASLEAGRADLRCLTFTSGRDGEAADAAEFARRLGLEHRVVSLPDDEEAVRATLVRAFERAPEPCGDPALIPYLLAAASIDCRAGERLIDGLNGDAWMGMPPSPAIVRGSRIARSPLRWLRPLRGWFPPEHPLSAALRTRAEWHFYGGRWPRHTETRTFYPGARDTGQTWERRGRELAGLDEFDFRSAVCGRDFELNGTTLKGEVATACFDLEAVFPFEDPALSAYYFHLPEPDRFDRETLTNKVLLRKLLRERLDYDDARIGKRVFEFDGVGFLRHHRAFVEEEIGGCELWNDQARSALARYLDRPSALRKCWPAVLAWFQLSGWIRRHLPEGEPA